MIGDDTLGHVDAIHVVFADEAAMTLRVTCQQQHDTHSRQPHASPRVCAGPGGRLDGAEQGRPQIRVVVAHLVLHDEDKEFDLFTSAMASTRS